MFFKSNTNKKFKSLVSDKYLERLSLEPYFYIGEEDFVSTSKSVKYIEFSGTESPEHSFSILLNKPVNMYDYESVKALVFLNDSGHGIYVTLKDKKFFCGNKDEISVDDLVDFICTLI